MFVLTEWGEVSVGGKLHPRPQHLCPVFSPLFNFLCAVVELVGTWGVFTVVSSYTCNCIVSDPVTSSCSSPNTRVHLYVLFYASAAFHLLTLNISVLWSGSLPHLWLQFSFFSASGCMCMYVCAFGVACFYGAGMYALCIGAFWCRSFWRPQIRKLRRELDASQEKVSALTTQLSANVRTSMQTAEYMYMYTASCQCFIKPQKIDSGVYYGPNNRQVAGCLGIWPKYWTSENLKIKTFLHFILQYF